MLVSKMRIHNPKYWPIPFSPILEKYGPHIGELFFKLSHNAKHQGKYRGSRKCHKKTTWNEMLLFKVLLWYKNNKQRCCCRIDLCLKPLYITCYISEHQPPHLWLRGNSICLSLLEWKLYLTYSKCSIRNCWTFWIKEGSHSASSLHFSPSFIKKPL